MELPKLKRVKLDTEQALETFLRKSVDGPSGVMIVTCCNRASSKYINSASVTAAAARHGWTSGRSFILKGQLSGHIISRD